MISLEFLNKLIRYGASSALALFVDVGLMWLLSELYGVHYLAAAAIGFSFGCVVNYVLSKTLVFEDNSHRAAATTFTLFALVGVGGLILNHIILFLSVDMLAMHLYAAKVVSTAVVFWFNFLIRGLYVFRDPAIRKASL